MVYEDATPTAVRLAGNTTTAKQFLTQTGTGTISAAPAWGTIANTDVSGLGTLSTLNSIDLTANVGATVLPILNGGTGSGTQNFVDLSSPQTKAGALTLTDSLYFSSGSTLESIYYDGSGVLWIANQDSSVGGRGNIKLSYSSTGGITFDLYGTGTQMFVGSSGFTFYNNLTFNSNNTHSIGDTSHYASNLYATTVNLNSTASLDGSTAGHLTVTGSLYSSKYVQSSGYSRANPTFTGGSNLNSGMQVNNNGTFFSQAGNSIVAYAVSGVTLSPGLSLGFNGTTADAAGNDIAFSRLAANSMALGNGTVGDTSGTLTLAHLKLGASTTSAASLNIPSGTAPTSPNTGDMWFDGTNLKFYDGTVTRTITWT
jgi:hypothetical protein